MKRMLSIFLILLLFTCSCQKKVLPPSPPETGTAGAATAKEVRPDEPVQRLAWETALQVQQAVQNLGLPPSLALAEIRNQAAWPPEAEKYFATALRNRLKEREIGIDKTSSLLLRGTLLKRDGQVVFAITLAKDQSTLFSDSASIQDNARLQNTLAQFDQIHIHKDASIPTPLAQLQEAPMDLLQACNKDNCSVLLLYADRLEVLEWHKRNLRSIRIPSRFFSQIRSRAPSGKIVRFGDGFLVMHNNLAAPLYFDAELAGPPGLYTTKPEWLPLPDPGRNSFTLHDGRFYDFDLIEQDKFAAIDTRNRLSIAASGRLTTSAESIGGTFTVLLPLIYTSSPNLPDKPDAILKFSFQEDSIHFESSRPVEGQILDLLISDLNQDQEQELLVTVRNSRGILVEVQDLF